ncbi:hypothetical protein [Leminorella grimontii]|uniref:hypothetical protein n=1 Tax=Leminorella grimontii TaxID=82981 RepID=UPI0032202CD4
MDTTRLTFTIASLAVGAVSTGLIFFLLHRLYLKKWHAVAFLYGAISSLACSAVTYGITSTIVSVPSMIEKLSLPHYITIVTLFNSLLLALPATYLFRNGTIKNTLSLFAINTFILFIYKKLTGGMISLMLFYLFYG